MGDLERRLTATLERVAASTRVRDRWDELAAVPRRPARVGWVALATGFAVVAAAIVAVPALLRTAPEPFDGGDGPDLVVVEGQPAPPLPEGQLPRLALDLPGATLVLADERRLPVETGVPAPVPGHHQYFAAGEHLAPPLLHVVSWTGPDGPPDELAEVVEVRGRDALLTRRGQFVALEWRDPDVSYVEVRAAGLSADQVVALVEAMELRDDPSLGFDVPGLPAGVAPVYEGPSPAPDPAYVSAWSTSVSYRLDGGEEVGIQLRLADRALPALADAVFAAARDAGSFEATEVRGMPALVARAEPGRAVVVWQEGPLVGTLFTDVPIGRLAEVTGSIREVPEVEWREMLAAAPLHPDQFPEGIELPPDAGAEREAHAVRLEACILAARWLEFDVAGQPAAAAAEAARLAELVAGAADVLAQAPNADAIVARRLAEAVRSGNRAGVEAEYAGTGLGDPQCG